MIIEPDFVDHWKTRMLVGLLGDDELAPVYLIRLWAHCQNRKAWVFETMPTLALKGVCHFKGDANDFEQALTTAGYIQRDGASVRVLGWDEYNASLIANWENGKKGGRPPKVKNPAETHGLPVANPDTTHANPSGKPIREEGIREEEPSQALPKNKGGSDAASPAPRSPSKASRLPQDWVLPKQLGDWALQERPDWTAEHVRKVADQFRDHWHAQGGANARKVDWAAAWRTWVRREPAGRVAGAGASAAPAAGWHETPEGVSAKGAELGLHQREGENRFVYRWRVLKAVGDAALIEKEVSAAARMNIAEHERAHQFFYGCLPGQMSRAA
ncbi:hypothetical protein JYK21_29640 [Ralstonia pickettii]|nr:hypothetical protein [Ralstonia pickettii]